MKKQIIIILVLATFSTVLFKSELFTYFNSNEEVYEPHINQVSKKDVNESKVEKKDFLVKSLKQKPVSKKIRSKSVVKKNTENDINSKEPENSQILENLQEVESRLLNGGKGVAYSLVNRINDDNYYFKTLKELESVSNLFPDAYENRSDFLDSFLQASNDLNSELVINELQCGQASCVGSFSTADYDTWKQFLANRTSGNNELYPPFYSLSHFSQLRNDGSIEHRVFFTTIAELNKVILSMQDYNGD